jgi:hypothetical protein
MHRKSQDQTVRDRGYDLIDLCIASRLRILNGRTLGDLNGKFTCHKTAGSSVVDYMITNEEMLNNVIFFQVQEFISTLSDHCQIMVQIRAKYCPKLQTSPLQLRRLPGKYVINDNGLQKYQEMLSTNGLQHKLQNIMKECNQPTADINSLTDNFAQIIHTAAKAAFRQPKNGRRRRSKPWFTTNLLQQKKEVLYLGKLLSKFPNDPQVRGSLFRKMTLYNRNRKKQYRQYKNNLINQLDELHEENPKAYWSLLDKIKNSQCEKGSKEDPITAETWVDYFQKINSVPDHLKAKSLAFTDLINKLEQCKHFNELDFPIKESEIMKALKGLKNGKCASIDNIANELLKYGSTHLLPCLTKLFNAILTRSTYPKQWSEGYISTIYKGGPATEPSNYRGLTITSSIGKLFNMVLNIRLNNFLGKYNIIKQEQIGFCKNTRTSDHMFVLKTLIHKYINNGKKLFACFVDFRRAFDSVLHSALFYKLQQLQIGGNFYHTIKHMYENSMSCIKSNGKITNLFPSNIGVRQGDVLSPNLFKIFINDLPDLFNDQCDPVYLHNKYLNCLMYADDVVLLSASQTGLQTCLNKLQTYCDTWGLTVNEKKTKVLIFNKAGRLIKGNFTLGTVSLEQVQTYKYLGIPFSASGTFGHAKSELYLKSLKASFKLIKSFGDLTPSVKTCLHLFNHTVKPILLYGSEIWGQFASSHKLLNPMSDDYILNKLFPKQKADRLQLKFYKYLLGVGKQCPDKAVFGELGELPFHTDILIQIAKYWHRCLTLETDSLLRDAYHYNTNLYNPDKFNLNINMQTILNQLNLSHLYHQAKNMTIVRFTSIVKKSLCEREHTSWKESLFNDPHNRGGGNKLRTYRKFKNILQLEKYLQCITNRDARRRLCQLRTSTHKLSIETGRHMKLPVEQRICPMCPSQAVEDELHFTIQCKAYCHPRETLFNPFATCGRAARV